MLSKNNRMGLALLLSCLFLACSTALYLPVASPGISNSDLGEMKQGRSLYINKCGSCHTLYLPEKYSAPQWKVQVRRMAEKAKLTTMEETRILRFVTKNRGVY
jgi:hypothetical protein